MGRNGLEERLDIRHPNSPLEEVVFEIRFPGETAIECRRHEFQAMIRDTYPRLLVPESKLEAPIALEPYRFAKDDESAGVMLGLNRLGHYTKGYQGFPFFKAECLRLIEIFQSLFSVDTLTRIGLRYVNIMPFVRERGFIPVEKYFDLAAKMLELLPNRFEDFSTAFVIPVERGKITIRIERVMEKGGTEEAMLLDFDYEEQEDLLMAQVDQYLDRAHERSKSLFRQLLTDSYRSYMEGEDEQP